MEAYLSDASSKQCPGFLAHQTIAGTMYHLSVPLQRGCSIERKWKDDSWVLCLD
jgi:hypothetical protein